MEIITKDIELSCSATEEGTYAPLYGLYKAPAVGGDPQKVDITNFGDAHTRSIPGVIDLGDLQFGFYYNDSETNPNVPSGATAAAYSTLRGYQTAGTPVWFKLTYPDDTGYQFSAMCSVKRDECGVNEAIKFTLTLNIVSAITDITA